MKNLRPILNADHSKSFYYNRVYAEGVFLAERKTTIEKTKALLNLNAWGDHFSTLLENGEEELLAVYLPPGTGHNEAVVVFSAGSNNAKGVFEFMMSVDENVRDVIVNCVMKDSMEAVVV